MKLLFTIAFRYLWPKHSFTFISFSSILSIIGIFFAVSSLIIISCISDGFNNTINSKLSNIDGHIRIYNYELYHSDKFKNVPPDIYKVKGKKYRSGNTNIASEF